MKEIQDIVNAQVLQMAESGEIQKQVEDGVKSAINSAIKKQFESWGNITKQLNEVFDKNLKVDHSQLNIPCLNSVMTEVVNKNINEFYKGQAAEKLHSLMHEKLSPLPDEMPIGDFVELICKEWFVEDYDCRDDVDEYATVTFEKESYGWYTLKMSKLSSSGYRSLPSEDLHLCIGKDGTLRGKHGSTNPTYLFNEDALIFKAYAQGVIFTGIEGFNPDDCDLQLKSYED